MHPHTQDRAGPSWSRNRPRVPIADPFHLKFLASCLNRRHERSEAIVQFRQGTYRTARSRLASAIADDQVSDVMFRRAPANHPHAGRRSRLRL